MGYDPMTHRPRTDIFNSLQHLIALANLKELMEHQYLQNLLQPRNISFNTSIQDIEAYNLLNSISSLKDSQFLGTNNHLENHLISTPNSSLQAIQDLIPFSHLPELQTSCSFQNSINKDKVRPQNTDFTVLSNGETLSPTSPWIPSALSPSPPRPSLTNDLTRKENSSEVVISSCLLEERKLPDYLFQSDSERSLSNEGAPTFIWPDLLLEDSFFQDIPKF